MGKGRFQIDELLMRVWARSVGRVVERVARHFTTYDPPPPEPKVKRKPVFHIENCKDETCLRDAIQEYLDRDSMRQGKIVIVGVKHYGDIVAFFYNSAEYVVSGDIMECLIGNAPLIVDQKNGNVFVTGTALPTEEYIDQYNRGVL